MNEERLSYGYRLVHEARMIATAIHEGQTRTNGARFVTHPISVHNILQNQGFEDHIMLAGALLHDTIEDGENPELVISSIRNMCDIQVLELVEELTVRPFEGMDKTTKQKLMLNKCKEMSNRAKCIKLADRLHNLRDCKKSWKSDSQKRYAEATKDLLHALDPVPGCVISLRILVNAEVESILK